MKYIVFGIPTYASDRILSIMASLNRTMGVYHVMGNDESNVPAIMATKKLIKESAFDVYHLTSYPGNAIPSFNVLPPGDFEYQLYQINYELYDFILYKVIEMIPKDIISVQTINNFILNNDKTIAAWKEQHDVANRTGDYDLSTVVQINAAQCLSDPVNYLSLVLDQPVDLVKHAVSAVSSTTNPGYKNQYNISEHYYGSLKDVLLSNNTIEHILKL